LSKNKLKIIDGSIEIPVSIDDTYEAWERANVIFLSWIIKSSSP